MKAKVTINIENYSNKTLMRILLLLLITLQLTPFFRINDSWAGKGPVGTYRQRMDPEWRKKFQPRKGYTYTKDDNVWVYTSEFQKRFGMPKEWADDGLTGAEAIAWRLEPVGRRRCHGEGESRECVPSYECVMESYIKSDETDLSFEHEMAFKPWKSSVAVLAKTHPEIKKNYNRAFGGPDGSLFLGSSEEPEKKRFEIMHYSTRMRKYLVHLSSLVDCQVGMANSKIERRVEYRNKQNDNKHQLNIPTSFWLTVQKYHASKTEITEKNWAAGTEEDNNIWVYTKKFAANYNLPTHTINTELQGAEAIAFRIEPRGYSTCGYFGLPTNCVNIKNSSFDLYLDQSAKMAYQEDKIMEGASSYRDLANSGFAALEQDRTMLPKKEINHNPITRHLGYVSYAYKFKYGLFNSKLSGWGGHAASFVNSYVKPGIWFDNTGVVTLHENSLSKKQIYNHFLFTDVIRGAPSSPWAYRNALHRVQMPASFIHAASDYEKAYEKQHGSVWQLVKDHYSGTNKHKAAQQDAEDEQTE